MSAAADYDEARVRRIFEHVLANGPPQSWRDLPADMIGVLTEADVHEATRRAKAADREVAEVNEAVAKRVAEALANRAGG